MAEDPDARWRPGYPAADEPEREETVRAPGSVEWSGLPDRFRPAAGRRRWQGGGSSRAATDPAPPDAPLVVVDGEAEVLVARGRPAGVGRRAVVALGAVMAVALAAVVAIVSFGGGDPEPRRPRPGEITGFDRRRLPAAVDTLWTAVLPGTGSALATSLLVAGDDLVVAVVDDGSRNRTSIAGLDATTGELRWRRGFSFAPPEVTLLGVVDGVVLVEQRDPSGRQLRGLSSDDGSTRWDRSAPAGGVSTVLLGTAVVTSVGGAVAGQVTFLDPATGRPVGDVVGELLGTDLSGTWYVAQGDSIAALDLSAGWSEPVAIPGRPPLAGDVAKVDGRLLALDGGRLVELADDPEPGPLDGGDELPELLGVFPAGASSVVARTDGGMLGAQVIDGAIRTTWTGDGDLRNFALTERGLVLVLGDDGAGFADGVELTVVDGISGDVLGGTGVVGSGDEPPLIVGNGFVVTTPTVEGVERTGYDLDGRERWRLPAAGTLRVGDELVVVMDATPAGYRLTGYGPSR